MAFWLGNKKKEEPTPVEKQQQSLQNFLETFDWSVLWAEPVEGGMLQKFLPYINTVLLIILLIILFLKK